MNKIPEGGLTLVCKTNNDDCQYASFLIDEEMAAGLLKCRDAWNAARDATDAILPEPYRHSFYCFEIWEYTPDVHTDWKGDEPLESGEWMSLATNPVGSLSGLVSISPCTLSVKANGVMWYMYDRQGDSGEFETEKLEWSQLEAVARGENPFKLLAGSKTTT